MSLNGQFQNIETFRIAMGKILGMREIAKKFGREIYCHRNLANAPVTYNLSLLQVIQRFDKDERQAIMQWLTKSGPFWEDTQLHHSSDYLECNGEVVTDTAIGEAAFNCFSGIQRDLISLTPSKWEYSPIQVDWIERDDVCRNLCVINHWEETKLESSLRNAPSPISSWKQLAHVAKARFTNITFSLNSFCYLDGYPFVEGVSRQILILLETLNRFRICFDERGERTSEGHEIYQKHFTGDKAWFSDSSDSEKNEFRESLTFVHPTKENCSLCCTWHGKVKIHQIRIHFSWPVSANEELYVVYIGPKRTKR
jgi:hypothetical protein